MKYSEYIQLLDVLEEQGITLEEFQANQQLYEGLIGNVAGKVFGLLKKGMKTLISKGVSQEYIKKLNDSANKIVQMVQDKLATKKDAEGKGGEGVIQSIEKNVETYKTTWSNKNNNAQVPPELQTKLDNKKNKEIAKYINGQVTVYSDKVKTSIKTKKGLSDNDRENLQNYWDQLMTKINVDVSGKLIENGILEDDDAYSVFKDILNIKKMGVGGEEPKPANPDLPKVGNVYTVLIGQAPTKVKITKIDNKTIYYVGLNSGQKGIKGEVPITAAKDFKPAS